MTRRRGRRTPLAGSATLSPQRKWRAITIATVVLAPAMWSIVIGAVAAGSEDADAPAAGPLLALGLCVIPFVFLALAFLSEHPRPSSGVSAAMVLCVLVGIPVSAFAGDAVTGLVAGIGAGGVVALRADLDHTWKARALAVLAASAYAFVFVRLAGELLLLISPVLPFTSLGIVDHLSERRAMRRRAAPVGRS
jgi:hypothetical protein